MQSLTSDKEKISYTLTRLGFLGNEAVVYTSLLAMKKANAYEIAKHSHVPRPKVYPALRHLAEYPAVHLEKDLSSYFDTQIFFATAIPPLEAFGPSINKMKENVTLARKGISNLETRYWEGIETIPALTILGLSAKEAYVFKSLVKTGKGSPAGVSFHSDVFISRTSVGMRLSSMRRKGMVEMGDDGLYSAKFPNKTFDERIERLDQEIIDVESGIQLLQSKFQHPLTNLSAANSP